MRHQADFLHQLAVKINRNDPKDVVTPEEEQRARSAFQYSLEELAWQAANPVRHEKLNPIGKWILAEPYPDQLELADLETICKKFAINPVPILLNIFKRIAKKDQWREFQEGQWVFPCFDFLRQYYREDATRYIQQNRRAIFSACADPHVAKLTRLLTFYINWGNIDLFEIGQEKLFAHFKWSKIKELDQLYYNRICSILYFIAQHIPPDCSGNNVASCPLPPDGRTTKKLFNLTKNLQQLIEKLNAAFNIKYNEYNRVYDQYKEIFEFAKSIWEKFQKNALRPAPSEFERNLFEALATANDNLALTQYLYPGLQLKKAEKQEFKQEVKASDPVTGTRDSFFVLEEDKSFLMCEDSKSETGTEFSSAQKPKACTPTLLYDTIFVRNRGNDNQFLMARYDEPEVARHEDLEIEPEAEGTERAKGIKFSAGSIKA